MPSIYESHNHPDPTFPVIFHLDSISFPTPANYLHWHENIEMLYCVEGNGTLTADSDRISFGAGDLAVINSDRLHSIYTEDSCRYYCLIADHSLFDGLGLPIGETPLRAVIRDSTVQGWFDTIVEEMLTRRPFYRESVRAAILSLYVHLYRHYTAENSDPAGKRPNNRVQMVKSAIAFLRRHYTEDLTVDQVCSSIGFSKYYLCHAFKEITGRTIISYINFLRCQNARGLLASGQYNISESAAQSGFHNLSYFSRIYKREMGELPSAKKP